MTDAPFIVAGWLGTAAALAAYAVAMRLRLRRAREAMKTGRPR